MILAFSAKFYTASPESVVVRLAIRGDQRAFEELVRRREQWIRGLMRRMATDPALADDLAQQTFLQAWRSIGQLQHPDRVAGWLKRMAVNTWLQHIRRNDPLAGDATALAWQTAPNQTPGAGIDLEQALGALPQDVRTCVVLAYHERMSHREIADATGMPLGTIKSHIRRGTERLRVQLSDYAVT